jgi:deoxyhypusine synthase
MMDTSPLNSRLRNCLATILELEDALERTHLGSALQDEFSLLKEVMQRLGDVKAEEDDVCRIEAATGRFLEELKDTLGKAATATDRGTSPRLLQ